jgi:putative transposase
MATSTRPGTNLASSCGAALRWYSTRYGTRRLQANLHAQSYRVGHWRIRRALAVAGLCGPPLRSVVPRSTGTDSDPNVRAASNRLLGQPVPTALN